MIAREYLKQGVVVHEMTAYELSQIHKTPMPDTHINKKLESACNRDSAKFGGPDWYGGASTQKQLDNLMANGWPEGAKRVKEFAERLYAKAPTPVSRRRKPRWASEGAELSIERAMAGRTEDMFRGAYRPFRTGPSILNLVFHWGGNCNKTAEELFWTGACGIVLCDVLESAGYAVKLTAGNFHYPNPHETTDQACINYIVLKEAQEPLRTDSLTFIACHAGCYRTFGFRTIVNLPLKVDNSLGRSMPLKELHKKLDSVGESPIDEYGIGKDGLYLLEEAHTEATALSVICDKIRLIEEGSAKLLAA